jgi:hypothetical protein
MAPPMNSLGRALRFGSDAGPDVFHLFAMGVLLDVSNEFFEVRDDGEVENILHDRAAPFWSWLAS